MADLITIDRAVVEQALSWILYTRRFLGIDEPKEERALRAALAQAEPVQRKPLTEEELQKVLYSVATSIDAPSVVMTHWPLVARAVEARLAAREAVKGGSNG